MKPGFYKNLSLEAYLKADGLSKSGLVDLADSPAHYQARKVEAKSFPAADLGTALHMLVLEPHRAERFIVTPPLTILGKNGSRNTNAYKEWAESLPGGTIILNASDCDSAQYMRDAVFAHSAASDLLRSGHAETSAFWEDGHGVLRKCRPDFLTDGPVLDLKTTVSANPEAFGRQSFSLQYHYSAAWSLDIIKGLTGANSRPYILVAVEKSLPWAVACYEVPQVLIDDAHEKIARLLATYRACLEIGSWPAYSDEVEPLFIPPWAIKKEKEDY
jgi:exodeoxyribonuclease VIII